MTCALFTPPGGLSDLGTALFVLLGFRMSLGGDRHAWTYCQCLGDTKVLRDLWGGLTLLQFMESCCSWDGLAWRSSCRPNGRTDIGMQKCDLLYRSTLLVSRNTSKSEKQAIPPTFLKCLILVRHLSKQCWKLDASNIQCLTKIGNTWSFPSPFVQTMAQQRGAEMQDFSWHPPNHYCLASAWDITLFIPRFAGLLIPQLSNTQNLDFHHHNTQGRH